MPVIPVIAAVGALTIGGGAAAIGAVVAGTATLATTLTAVAAVGATLGAIGAVTHDKTLSTVGMVMGGIGGIGALAANAGLLGASATTESLFGSGSSAAADAASVGTTAAGDISPALSGAVPGMTADAMTSMNTDIINTLGEANAQISNQALSVEDQIGAAAGNAANLAPKGLSGLLNNTPDPATMAARLNPTPSGLNAAPSPLTTGAVQPPAGEVTPSAMPSAPGTATPSAPSSDVTGSPTTVMPKNPTLGQTFTGADGETYKYTGAGSTGWEAQKGFFSSLVSSPSGQLGMLQAGGSLISGMFDTLKPAQVDALNAQAAVNRAAATLATTQQANMNAPIPIARRAVPANVTGAPAGIINSQPQGAAA